MSEPDTKQRILSAAEHHFARDGYHATSLRSITTAAKANLAAVNYHFGSKESLLEAVIERRLAPLNEVRLGQLEMLLKKAEQAKEMPVCRDVLRTFIEPTLRLRLQGSDSEDFVALIGRILAEPRGVAMTIFMAHMEPLMNRLFQALSLSLPGLSSQVLFWRVHFALGSLSHIMRCHERHAMVPEDVSVEMDVGDLVELFLDFATAGMEGKKC
jgi:AcrR family transcriptional regulator